MVKIRYFLAEQTKTTSESFIWNYYCHTREYLPIWWCIAVHITKRKRFVKISNNSKAWIIKQFWGNVSSLLLLINGSWWNNAIDAKIIIHSVGLIGLIKIFYFYNDLIYTNRGKCLQLIKGKRSNTNHHTSSHQLC